MIFKYFDGFQIRTPLQFWYICWLIKSAYCHLSILSNFVTRFEFTCLDDLRILHFRKILILHVKWLLFIRKKYFQIIKKKLSKLNEALLWSFLFTKFLSSSRRARLHFKLGQLLIIAIFEIVKQSRNCVKISCFMKLFTCKYYLTGSIHIKIINSNGILKLNLLWIMTMLLSIRGINDL